MATTYFVVTYRDHNGVPLYVDVTTNPVLNQDIHHHNDEWSEFVAGCTYDRFPTLAGAQAVQARKVDEIKPLFNAWPDEEAQDRRLVDYLIERGRRDLLAPEISEG